MEQYRTLADTLKVYYDLPIYLDFEEDPSLIINGNKDAMYENMYVEARYLSKLKEAKGTRKVMAPYFYNTPEEEISWSDFLSKNPEGVKEINMTKSDFNKEYAIYKKDPEAYGPKYVGRAAVKKESEEDDDDDDDAPELNMDDPEVSPTLKKLYQISKAAKEKTESVEDIVNRKYKAIFDTVRNVANGISLNSHCVCTGAAGCGKTHTVRQGAKVGLEQWKPNKRMTGKPQMVYISGAVGNSLTDLVTFFYVNRFQKLIILDDADGFLVNSSADIQNLLKRILDPDFQTVRIPMEIKKRTNKNLTDEAEISSKKESSKISLDLTHLKENKCSVNVNGFKIDFTPTERDIKKLKETFRIKEASSDSVIDKARNNPLQDSEDDNLDLLESPQFEFISNVIVVSNLNLSDIDEAVISRCDQVELHLTIPEFICRAEMILDKLEMGINSSMNKEVIDWAKKEAFAIFKILILEGRKYKGLNFPINVHLDFRFLNKITNRMIIRINDYCLENNVDPMDKSKRPEIENAIEEDFIQDLLTLLATGNKAKK